MHLSSAVCPQADPSRTDAPFDNLYAKAMQKKPKRNASRATHMITQTSPSPKPHRNYTEDSNQNLNKDSLANNQNTAAVRQSKTEKNNAQKKLGYLRRNLGILGKHNLCHSRHKTSSSLSGGNQVDDLCLFLPS